jgi:alanine dehydrogenase
MAGLNTYDGQITCPPVAESLGLPAADPAALV